MYVLWYLEHMENMFKDSISIRSSFTQDDLAHTILFIIYASSSLVMYVVELEGHVNYANKNSK